MSLFLYSKPTNKKPTTPHNLFILHSTKKKFEFTYYASSNTKKHDSLKKKQKKKKKKKKKGIGKVTTGIHGT